MEERIQKHYLSDYKMFREIQSPIYLFDGTAIYEMVRGKCSLKLAW